MTVKELRQQDKKELQKTLVEKNKELIDKKLELKIGKEKNTSIVKKLKKEIAQIKTVIREKEVLNEG